MIKFLLRSLLRVLFGFKAYDDKALKTPGPVLLIPNHASWIDWLFLYVLLDEDWRFVSSSRTAQYSWLHRWIMINDRTFPVDSSSPYAVKRMAEFLQKNGKLVLFAEGRISHTGRLGKIFDGTGFLLNKTNAKVIGCYLRGTDRLPFSPNRNAKCWFPRIAAYFTPLTEKPRFENPRSVERRIRLTHWLHDFLVHFQFLVESRRTPEHVLSAIVQTARQRPKQIVLEDTTGQELTYRKLLAGTQALASQWNKLLGTGNEPVGVLLPNLNVTVLVFLSLWAKGKVPAPLNYSSGAAAILACIKLAGIKKVIASQTFLERARLKAEEFTQAGVEFIWIEDVGQALSGWARLTALLSVMLCPSRLIAHAPKAQETAVILFTSGSEGMPKGVILSHANLMANIEQVLSINDLDDAVRLFNCLPLFHSFSFTVGTLLPLVRGFYLYLYPSPIHYRIIPTLFYDLECTMLISTNTFLNGYARRAHPYDFHNLRYLFAGAEKTQDATMDTWAQRFGVRILQAYGTTECSPAISANTVMSPKHGSVGRFLPGIEHRLEPIEGITEGGRLFVKGPNVMKGYLTEEVNASFAKLNGWYDTGDIATVDPEGFLTIQGRMKRFAKISGEMVSLTAIEEALAGALAHYGNRFQIAVIPKEDAGKGEKLVAVTNEAKLKVDEIRSALQAKGLNNLSAPSEIKVIPEMPKLGTGKLDYRKLQELVTAEKTAGS